MAKDPTQTAIDELEKEAHPFELIVGEESGEILNGDIPVRWCVTPKLVSELEEHEVEDAHVLLVTVTSHGDEMDRKVVPITELMTYVRFTRAGNMKIYGFIVSGASGRKDLYQTYKRKENGSYKTDIICYYTEKPYDDIKFEYTRTEVDVIIPSGVFGKEPGPWMKWFVNMWHTSSGRVVDECHFRRRMILAFTLKWIPVVIWTLMLVIGRLGFAIGMALSGYFKGMHWGRIFRPYEWSNFRYHIIDKVPKRNSFLLHRTHKSIWTGHKSDVPMFITVPFIPAVLLAQTAIISVVLALLTNPPIGFWELMSRVSIALFSIVAAYDIGHWLLDQASNSEWLNTFGNRLDKRLTNISKRIAPFMKMKYVIWLGYAVIAALFVFAATIWVMIAIYGLPVIILGFLLLKFGDAWFERFENMYTVSPENNDYTEIRELLCPKDELNLRADIDFIPPKQRTVRLWYLEMKHKVCKPMQQ